MKIVCMLGKTIGYLVAEKMLALAGHDVRYVCNDGETAGEWYRTPRELPIAEIAESDVVAFAPDLIIVAFYDRILPPEIFNQPRLGAWNLHLGDCEKYRGAYPNVWALKNGDAEYAVTLHRIDAGTDTGPILARREFSVEPECTGRDIYDAMVIEGAALFGGCLGALLSGSAIESARPQIGANAVTHYRRELSHEIDVPETVKNDVRALTFEPFPPPYFKIGTRKFFIVGEHEKSGKPRLGAFGAGVWE